MGKVHHFDYHNKEGLVWKEPPLNPISISEISQIAWHSASALERLIDFLLLTFLRNEIKDEESRDSKEREERAVSEEDDFLPSIPL